MLDVHYSSAFPSYLESCTGSSAVWDQPAHRQRYPSATTGSTRFEAGLASPVSSNVGESTKDMTSFYAPSFSSSSGGDNGSSSYGSRRPDYRYDSGSASYPYDAYIHSQPPSRSISRVASPEFQPSHPHDHKRSGANSSIHPYLRLPASISPTGGSLTEFAAQTTCLFWFEPSSTLTRLEEPSCSPVHRSSLSSNSTPATGFLKWVTTILSTTQVTQNVVLLALLFIRRLKNLNPTVKGKPGSEYRLLTVALMLGNKFLDDNTYTNKTWAEVSGISVSEIHVMEVEFLSHMKYNLYTTKEEWEQWHKQLSSLWRFFNTRIDNVSPSRPSVMRPTLQIPRGLPSPPGSTLASSPYAQTNSPALPLGVNTPQSLPQVTLPQHLTAFQPPALDASSSMPPRKRSWDESAVMSAVEPPYKRVFNTDSYASSRTLTPTYTFPPQLPGHKDSYASSRTMTPTHAFPPQLPSLPVPHSSLAQSMPQAYSSPLAPVSSARSATNTLPGFNWPPQGSVLTPRTQQSGLQTSPNALAERGPHSTMQYDSLSSRPSPTAANFSSAAAHTSIQHQQSPSYFLHQRSSPYKPVRDIRTLLGPASSGHLQSRPQQVPQDHMYWQPLGRHNERQTGRVPYLHREAWPESNQFQGWDATAQLNG